MYTKKKDVQQNVKDRKIAKEGKRKAKEQVANQTGEDEIMPNKTLDELIKSTPTWWIDLFNYVHLFEELDIDVTKESISSSNPKHDQFKARYLERQLFLIFECLPKNRPDTDERITQKQFAKLAGVSETVLGMWKKQEWFWGNRVRMMKRIFSMHTPDIIEALYRGAIQQNYITGVYDAKCIKLWLEYIEGFTPGIDVSAKTEGLIIQFASGPTPYIEAPTEEKELNSQEN